MDIIKICQRVGAISLALIAAAAGASEPAQTDRKRNLLELQAREGKTTLGDLNSKGGLDDLLRGLDFFSGCDGRRNPLPISAEDFLMHNAKHIGGLLTKLEKQKGVPAENLIAKVKLYEKINEAKTFLLAVNKTEQEMKANLQQARKILMNLTVNEFLEALPLEIRHYDRVAKIACDLIGPEHNSEKTLAPSINVQGFAFKKIKENWQQAYLTSSPAADRTKRASAIHIYPENTLFNAPEEYVDDTIAALISHELIHGYQHQVNGVAIGDCEAGSSVISLRKRSKTTRVQLDSDAWRLYEQRRNQELKARTMANAAIGAVAGAAAGYGLGKIAGVKTGWGTALATGIGAAAVAGFAAPAAPVRSLRDLPSLEYEADVEGVLLACKRGYHVEGFRHLFNNIESAPGNAALNPSDSQRDVIATIDIVEEANKYEEANCSYHPDTRLRYVNLMATAKALCPADTRMPNTLAPYAAGPSAAGSGVSSAPPKSGTSRTGAPTPRAEAADAGPATAARMSRHTSRKVAAGAVSPRMNRFRERCLNSDDCMRMIVDNAATLIGTSGEVPEQARAGTAQPSQTPPPVGRTVQQADDGAGRSSGRAQARIILSNGYCDIDKMPGKWTGRYSHSGVFVPFELVLSAASGALTGESTEPDTRPGQTGTVTARWAGVLSGRGMVFERRYVVAPSVVSHYYGYCDMENTVISGEWRLGDSLSGQFELLKE